MESLLENPKYPPYLKLLPLIHQGKVRDTFGHTTTHGTMLVVATDRISTHDIVHSNLIPGKGEILTAMTIFWMREAFQNIPHHIVAYGKDIYDHLPDDALYPEDLHLRGLIVKELDMVPREFIFRARMGGSVWNKYYSRGLGNPYGVDFPEGLRLMDELSPIAFTPTEKSATDDPVNARHTESLYPQEMELARRVYYLGREYALKRGIDIIDFKCEVGRDKDGKAKIGDEWLNGDCCRLVKSSDIVIGQNPPWMDKQVFRDDAERQWAEMGGEKVPLTFSPKIVADGIHAYDTAFEMLTGGTLESFQDEYLN